MQNKNVAYTIRKCNMHDKCNRQTHKQCKLQQHVKTSASAGEPKMLRLWWKYPCLTNSHTYNQTCPITRRQGAWDLK